MEAPARARTHEQHKAQKNLVAIRNLIQDELHLVEQEMARALRTDIDIVEELVAHLLKQQSKRFRPMVLLLAARSQGSVDEKVVGAAAAVELIHTATLVHDDIIDGSQTRRGLPTINCLWDDPTSVVLGDFLYSRGLDLMASANLPEVSMILARVTHRMSKGEMLQLESRGNLELSEESYLRMIGEKTASLIGGCCEIGCILSSSEEKMAGNFRRFGEKIGAAFQITDDVQDFLGTEEELGKPVGSDLMGGRVTLPFIVSYRNSPSEAKKKIREDLRPENAEAADWKSISRFVLDHGGIEYSLETSRSFGREAKREIDPLPASPAKEALMFAVDYVTTRAE
jgi:geranylgeranyl pyrophosphate synthase